MSDRYAYGGHSSSTASTSPREERETQSQVPGPTLKRVILDMPGTLRPLAKAGDQGPAFSAAAFVPTTPDQMAALRFLRAQPVPLKPKRIIRQTSWSLARVRRWLAFFAAKGVLVPTPAGHVWRAA